MLNGKKLYEFAELTLKIGVNLQKGQGVEIACPVEKPEVAEAFTETAYKLGASIVRIRWENEKTDRLNFLYADTAALTDIPAHVIESKNDLINRGFCYVAIAAENPTAFADVPQEKLAAYSKARSNKLKKFSEQVMKNGIRWCVVSVPTAEWAKQVFAGEKNAEEKLSAAIEKTMRLDCQDPLSAWEKHIKRLDERAEFLNKNRFSYLHFKSKNGTDLRVGLADEHVWLSAKERAADGVCFVANMPTEEVFTAPHNKRIDGVVKSALPLSYNGKLINNFSLTFKKGKVVDYTAESGLDALKQIIETDKGTTSLGEVALIGKRSPIAESGVLFYNTLFDENASCHIALGKAYPTTVKGGENLSKTQLKNMGVNDSVEHVDFMIGTPDLSVTGVKESGEQVTLFADGEWVI